MSAKNRMLTTLVACALSFVFAEARAQTSSAAAAYPAKPIRVIDAYPPGGSTDVVARIIAVKFQESMGRAWIIDNRPGAQGIIGTELVSKSPPDGYTLLMFTGSHTVHPSIYRNLPYDFLQAFAPITQTSATTNVLVVHPSLPVKTLKEVIALARSKPGQLNYSSAGIGSTTHMAMELLKSLAKVDIAHIPYKGSAPAVIDGVAGHVAMLFGPMPVVTPHAKAGRLRLIAVSTRQRSRAIPQVPTIAEAGVPGYEATNSVGIVAPAATPREIVTSSTPRSCASSSCRTFRRS
ncbi:MAG TPA: tripartite tricarboxylate transporter substrate binding protein [Burkholderiales bacterium]|nr:tripartite tricarboxylate transporter substrate binding protein [Burkholderiales bacterium]